MQVKQQAIEWRDDDRHISTLSMSSVEEGLPMNDMTTSAHTHLEGLHDLE
jgi:hypothetical protein